MATEKDVGTAVSDAIRCDFMPVPRSPTPLGWSRADSLLFFSGVQASLNRVDDVNRRYITLSVIEQPRILL